jgi:hypothetical protein
VEWGPAPKPPGFCAYGPITGAPTIGSETTEEVAPARQFDNAGAPVIGIAAALECERPPELPLTPLLGWQAVVSLVRIQEEVDDGACIGSCQGCFVA